MNAAPLPSGAAFAAELAALGFVTIPLRASADPKERKIPAAEAWQRRTFSATDWKPGQGVGVRCGPLRGPQEGTRVCGGVGLRLVVPDFDQHTPEQRGREAYERTLATLPPELASRLTARARSTNGNGRYLPFLTTADIPDGTLRLDGETVGEVLATSGRQVVAITPDRWLQGDWATLPILDELETDLLLAAMGYWPTLSAPAKTAPLAVADVVIRAIAEHPELLEDAAGVPRGLGTGISARLLTGTAPITNASEARYMVAMQLMRVGYANEEIIGYLCARCDWAGNGKRGPNQILDDAMRIVGKLEAAMPHRHVHTASKRRCAELRDEPEGADNKSKRGRPPSQPEQRLTAYLTQYPEAADWTTAQLADALGCTDRSIRRYRATLRGADNKSMPPSAPILPLQDAQNDAPPPLLEGTCSPPPPACPPSAEPCYAAEDVPPAAVRLDEAMLAMIEAVAREGRVSKRRTRAVFAEYFPQLPWYDGVYLRVMRRRRLESPGSADYFDQLRAMTAEELNRALKGLDGRIAKYSRIFGTEPGAKPKGERQTQKQLQTRRRHVQNELRRRARNTSSPVPVLELEPVTVPTNPRLPLLPRGWDWCWTPSTSLHQAHERETKRKTGVYSTDTLGALVNEVRRLVTKGV